MSPRYRCFAFVWALLLAVAADGEEYNIRLSHPEKVGDAYIRSVHAQFKMDNTSRVRGYPPQRRQEAFTVEMEGTVQVLAVDEKSGQATRLSCTVSKLARDGRPLFPEGTVVVAENKEGTTQYTVDGQQVAPPAAQALGEVLSAHTPGAPDNDDTLFGTNEPKKVGDTWPADRQAAARAFSHEGVEVSKDHVTGTVRLAAVKEVEGKKVLDIETDVDLTDLKGVLRDVTVVTGGTLSLHAAGLYPADGQGMRDSNTMSWKLNMRVDGLTLADEPSHVDVNIERSATIIMKEAGK